MLTILPIFYLSILTIFLLMLSWVITKQLKTIFLLESQFQYFLDESQNVTLKAEEVLAFAKVCVAKQCFTKAVIESHFALKTYNAAKYQLTLAQIYNMLGFIYYEASQKTLAKEFYQKAIELDPNYIIALNNLAKIYEDIQDLKKALILYSKVLNLNPSNHIATNRKIVIEKTANL